MKARVKFNKEIIDVLQVGTKTHLYNLENIEFLDNPQDYWEKLKHQYAGMAMQGILSNQDYCKLLIDENNVGSFADDVSRCAKDFATALIEKLKGE